MITNLSSEIPYLALHSFPATAPSNAFWDLIRFVLTGSVASPPLKHLNRNPTSSFCKWQTHRAFVSFYPFSSLMDLIPLAPLLNAFLLWLAYLFWWVLLLSLMSFVDSFAGSSFLFWYIMWGSVLAFISPLDVLTDPSTLAWNSANVNDSQICFLSPDSLSWSSVYPFA